MPSFHYRAVTQIGDLIQGIIDAPDRAAAAARLHEEGALPLKIVPARRALSWRTEPHLSARDLAELMRRLATLVGAGVPIEAAVAILGERDAKPTPRRVVQDLLKRLRRGDRLSAAMAAEDASFPPAVVSMIEAGEIGGDLSATLGRLSDYLHRRNEAREAMRSALIYPAILVATATVSMTIVFTSVLPALRPVIENTGAVVPLPVRIAFGLSDAVQAAWWQLLLGIVLAALLARQVLIRPAGRRWRDRALLKLPLIGSALLRGDFSRFARTLGTLLEGGVAMPAALETAQRVLSNGVVAAAVDRVHTAVREGAGLAEQLAKARIFPDIAVEMMRIGEATGQPARMLLQLADMLDHDVRRDLGRMLAWLVPLVTIGLGVMVAGIVVSVMLAVLSMNDLAQ